MTLGVAIGWFIRNKKWIATFYGKRLEIILSVTDPLLLVRDFRLIISCFEFFR